MKKIILAEPRGFCAGVNRAIEIVNLALEIYGTPLYVRHEIVHNHHVVDDFKNRGVIFIEELDDVPDHSVVIFSAHGTSPAVINAAKKRDLKFIDAVCPLVTKVHLEITKAIQNNKKVIYIGHRGHQEVLGAFGYSGNNIDRGTKESYKEQFNSEQEIFLIENVDQVSKLKNAIGDQACVVATQTTLSVDDTKNIMEELSRYFTKLELPRTDDICYATQNRQDAVKELAKITDHILIIGSTSSSNTLRLVELAHKLGKTCQLVSDPENFKLEAEHHNKIIGISSGASAPEFLVDQLIARLLEDKDFQYREKNLSKYKDLIEELKFKEEKIVFPLPASVKS